MVALGERSEGDRATGGKFFEGDPQAAAHHRRTLPRRASGLLTTRTWRHMVSILVAQPPQGLASER